jgi:hypothetical protein
MIYVNNNHRIIKIDLTLLINVRSALTKCIEIYKIVKSRHSLRELGYSIFFFLYQDLLNFIDLIMCRSPVHYLFINNFNTQTYCLLKNGAKNSLFNKQSRLLILKNYTLNSLAKFCMVIISRNIFKLHFWFSD